MANVKISVVTVVLNASSSIEKCVASVLGQTYDNIEYLVIDGGSTDGTLDILARFRHIIDYLVSESDRGLYHAMNKGIHAARGDFVYFLNSDDTFCDENVVADVAAAISPNPMIDLIHGHVLAHSGGLLFQDVQVKVLNRRSHCCWGLCHQALFARRDLFKRIGGFSEEYRIVADGDWLARALAVGATALHLDRNIAVFARNGLSGTTNWGEEKQRYLKANFTRWERFWWRKLPRMLSMRRQPHPGP